MDICVLDLNLHFLFQLGWIGLHWRGRVKVGFLFVLLVDIILLCVFALCFFFFTLFIDLLKCERTKREVSMPSIKLLFQRCLVFALFLSIVELVKLAHLFCSLHDQVSCALYRRRIRNLLNHVFVQVRCARLSWRVHLVIMHTSSHTCVCICFVDRHSWHTFLLL